MILAILQARTSSTRLPGKVLKPILGEPMIVRHIERLRRCRSFDRLIVATSIDPSDDVLEATARRQGYDLYRGSLEDVLDRFYQAAKIYSPTHVVRLTADCPLADPGVIDQAVELATKGEYDFTSNAIIRTYPDGLDVEVLTFRTLETLWRDTERLEDRGHVTTLMYDHPERFNLGHLKNSHDLSALRWTVDRPEDFDLVERIYRELYPVNPSFSTEDILRYLAHHPEMVLFGKSGSREECWHVLEKYAKGQP